MLGKGKGLGPRIGEAEGVAVWGEGAAPGTEAGTAQMLLEVWRAQRVAQ